MPFTSPLRPQRAPHSSFLERVATGTGTFQACLVETPPPTATRPHQGQDWSFPLCPIKGSMAFPTALDPELALKDSGPRYVLDGRCPLPQCLASSRAKALD